MSATMADTSTRVQIVVVVDVQSTRSVVTDLHAILNSAIYQQKVSISNPPLYDHDYNEETAGQVGCFCCRERI